MKAILEFHLPEEESDYKDASQGARWHNLLCDLDDHLRQSIKHGNKKEYRAIRDWLNNKILDRGLCLYE
jgi:hypothetical protein